MELERVADENRSLKESIVKDNSYTVYTSLEGEPFIHLAYS